MNERKHPFGFTLEALIYPLLMLIILWVIQWMDSLFAIDFYKWGLKPRTIEGLKGIFFMPLLHSQNDIHHLLNNSLVLFLLLAVLIYYYRDIALKVFVFTWFLTGVFVWFYAENTGSYHIGMSGVIYGLLGFLFTSGVLRKYLPLQAISLFLVFVYGNMIWGIFPIDRSISWEGHFMGLVAGLLLAFAYKNKSVQRPKFQYEVELDLDDGWDKRLNPSESFRSNEHVTSTEKQSKIVYIYIDALNEKTKEQSQTNETNSFLDDNDEATHP